MNKRESQLFYNAILKRVGKALLIVLPIMIIVGMLVYKYISNFWLGVIYVGILTISLFVEMYIHNILSKKKTTTKTKNDVFK